MPEVDFDWVKAQLTQAKTRQAPGDAVIALLKVWETMDFPNEDQQDSAVDLFTKLAKSHSLIPDTGERWVSAQTGFMLSVGDEVRVRSDAFSGEAGRIHNGRRGKIVAKRSGDIIVKHTDGKKPSRDDARYPASALEKKV